MSASLLASVREAFLSRAFGPSMAWHASSSVKALTTASSSIFTRQKIPATLMPPVKKEPQIFVQV